MEKIKVLEMLAKSDPEYLEMLQRIKIFEEKIDELEKELNEEQRNLIWDFWGLSCEIERRKLELACAYMEFRE